MVWYQDHAVLWPTSLQIRNQLSIFIYKKRMIYYENRTIGLLLLHSSRNLAKPAVLIWWCVVVLASLIDVNGILLQTLVWAMEGLKIVCMANIKNITHSSMYMKYIDKNRCFHWGQIDMNSVCFVALKTYSYQIYLINVRLKMFIHIKAKRVFNISFFHIIILSSSCWLVEWVRVRVLYINRLS